MSVKIHIQKSYFIIHFGVLIKSHVYSRSVASLGKKNHTKMCFDVENEPMYDNNNVPLKVLHVLHLKFV